MEAAKPRDAMTKRIFIVASAVISLAFVVWQCVWAVATPSFRGPDEIQHFNSILRVATTGDWPDPGGATIDSQVVIAIHEAGFMAGDPDFFAIANKSPLRGGMGEFAGYATPYQFATITPHLDRTVIDYGTTEPTNLTDQMTQHPPLYYMVVGGVIKTLGALDWTWDRQLLLARIVSILMTAPIVPALIFTARRVGLSRRTSLVTGVLAFIVPQLVFVTSVVTNDALAIGAGALTIAACAAGMFGKGSWRAVICAGLALGLGLWSKGTFLPFGLVVGLAFVLNRQAGSARMRWLKGISAGLIGVVTGGFWWIRNLVTFGTLQPSGLSRHSVEEGTDFVKFLRQAFRLFVDSSWGEFGWLEWWLRAPVIAVLAGVTALLLIISLAKGPDLLKKLNLLGFYFLVGIVLLVQAWSAFQETGYTQGIQGRYLFPGIVGMLVVAALPWARAMDRRGSSWPLLIAPAISVLVGGYALADWLLACYFSENSVIFLDWTRWSLATGFEISSLHMVIMVAGLSLAIAALTPAVASFHANRHSRVLDA
ncbi:DUF2142 domain-containing protein [Changpingibacter yushuensis]|uniref:DUF2142 domain-containing protein n=1 Tax=Changpingibacter yushuensis TaxID=2758440 RepID=UPI00165DDCFF|nr:DUF2142 domain-containing protein [Changpingibacter yushuensis]